VQTHDFFSSHPVISLGEATEALEPRGGRAGAVERLKYHITRGRLKLVTREIYAVVPPGVASGRFHPDPFLVAAAIRPEGVFSHHSALELLGAAHSVWDQYTLYVEHRRRSLALDSTTIRFLDYSKVIQTESDRKIGIRKVERRGRSG